MTIRDIVTIPEPILRRIAKPVTQFDDALKTLVADMLETMHIANGIGLAAPQIGVSLQVAVVDVSPRDKHDGAPWVMINPEIIATSEDSSTYEEGCLSIPGYYADVTRPEAITVAFTTLDGTRVQHDIDGVLATCVQHEIDHLNGKLFIDYLSRLKRGMVERKFNKRATTDGTRYTPPLPAQMNSA